jgi:uncharacterized protein (TIGR03435 family)
MVSDTIYKAPNARPPRIKRIIRSMQRILLVLTAVAGLAAGQTFDVATIHQASMPSTQDLAKAIQGGTLRIGQQIQGNQVSFNLMPLRSLAAIAYEVKPLQVTGPDWAMNQPYNITALMPEGSNPKQIPAMLQALLKERFKLVAHKTDAAQDIYALQVAKDGHKMKPAPAPAPEPAADAPAKPGERTLNIGGQEIKVNQAAGAGGGSAVVSTAANGTQKISMSPDGKMHMEIERMTMAQLAETLTPMMDYPVVDRTGLTGAFTLALDMSMADIMNVARKAGAGIAGALPAGAAPGGLGGLAASDPGGDLTAAVQKLGLRLDKQKAPVDALIIESAEKTPTEN